MPVIDGRTWLEHLSPERCWERLAQVPVGRLGVLIDSAPEIYPVNHVVDQRTIVFRIDQGDRIIGELLSSTDHRRLSPGEVTLILRQEDGAREIEIDLKRRFRVSPQIASAIKAAPGVIDVELA